MNWFHSCQRVAELLSQRLDEPLGFIDDLRLRVHLSMCGDCRRVGRQLAQMDAPTADLFAGDTPIEDPGAAAAPADPTASSAPHSVATPKGS